MKNLKYEYSNILKNIDSYLIHSLKNLDIQKFISNWISIHLDFLEKNLDKNVSWPTNSLINKDNISKHSLFLMKRNYLVDNVLDKLSEKDSFFHVKKELSKYITVHDKQLIELLKKYSSNLKLESSLLHKKQSITKEYLKNVY